MNILILTQHWYPDTFGGSEHVASEQARRLAARGHHVTVLTQRVRDDLPQEATEGTLRMFRYGSERQFARFGGMSRTDIQELPPLVRRFGQKQTYDAAILHHPFPAYGFFKAKQKIPSLYLFHTSTAREAEVEGIRNHHSPLLKSLRPFLISSFIAGAARVERRVLRHVTKIAVLSDFSWAILEGAYPFTKKKVSKLPIGIDQKLFAPVKDRKKVRAHLHISPEKTVLLTVRRFTPRMGLIELVHAMKEVVRTIPDAALYIVGEGSLKEAIQEAIKECNLEESVFLVGKVSMDELPQYYQAADLFVLPSLAFEGLGMATLEALACGLPVVGTPAGATLEVLGALDSTLVTSGTGVSDLAQGICGYFARPQQERDPLRSKAREVAETLYNWDKAIDELEALLKSL